MLGTILVSEALALLSNEAFIRGLGSTPEDTAETKRASTHYPALLDSIRQHGITTPIHIKTTRHGRFLVEGHHRITAAADAGLATIPWTDDPTLADRIEAMPWQLTPGTITPAAIEAFTRAACAGLAVALHDATGWPIVEVGHCDNLPLHFMVRHPDGRLVDIRGAHADEAVCDEWEFDADGDVSLAEAARADVLDCYLADCGEPVPMDLVATFAPAVIALAA
ncbi:ParB/Srx family N-terminal domain-containing protein [Streptomyces sp. SID4982]|uniref:ParB/Srx family N-terminal domain-containing protein n=1 Tax=Streptomyces sp. SID4982 TaxID=2690291 RepID=UPI00136ABFB2|nr:ParB/Srx family N-terminal domain-containing protein [Streptomyces sp. SID4982]MYS16130.1 ParB N-terminal domain-containing protein [Streptomyces sp. SID4982]